MTATDLERSALLTDAGRMKDVFQAGLPGFASGGLLISDCRIVHTRYRTSRAERHEGKPFLSVCYSLDVRDVARARRGTQIVHGKAYRTTQTRRRFAEAKARHRFEPAFGEAVAHLADLDLVVWAFPNDPKLLHLPEVIDPRAVKRHLPYDRLPAGLDAAEHIYEVDVEVVRYKPEVRCITRYRLAGAEGRTFTLYGKTFKHERAREIARRIESMCRRSADDPDGFIVPQPLGYDDSVKTVWQTGLSGTPLIDVVRGGEYGDFIERAARGLASLHRIDPGGLSRITLGDRLAPVLAAAAELAEAFPRLRARLEALAFRLENEAPRLSPGRDGLVHGDFLLKQLVVHDGRLGVFDFDNFTLGDPAQDLANFLVDLHYQGFPAGLVSSMTTAFLDGYRSHTEGGMPADRLRWHAGVQVLSDAYYFHKRRHLAPDFEVELEHILTLGQDVLGTSQAPSRP